LHADDDWFVATQEGLWVAWVRMGQDFVPIGFSGSRGLAECMASSIATQVITHRLRQDWRLSQTRTPF
jgi:hypothetical protein